MFCDLIMTVSYTLFSCQYSLQRQCFSALTAYSVACDNLSQSLKHICRPNSLEKILSQATIYDLGRQYVTRVPA